ncbi:helix-turn-helix domain-containing protein [Mesorhizobium sp. B2-4-5]|nr:helix-turn-helix domain-containing protein [Mesorhizobium sp. B2-4-5]
MKRTAWLQDRRMQKFRDVLSRWNGGDLSMTEAGELLGMSERQFRRYRDRYEEAGEAGLLDRRLGKNSTRRVMMLHQDGRRVLRLASISIMSATLPVQVRDGEAISGNSASWACLRRISARIGIARR